VIASARVGENGLRKLEDRFADRLVAGAVATGHSVLVARRARAFIDLNRHPAELDAYSASGLPRGMALRSSPKLRGGLGLVPRRHHLVGDLWRKAPCWEDVAGRINDIHAPYHDGIAAILEAKRQRFGQALIIDVHSMPPLRSNGDADAIRFVVGNRFGQSADPGLARAAATFIADRGHGVALNAPYAGDYTLERHGRGGGAIQALQLEIDRSLYLTDGSDEPHDGEGDLVRLIADLADYLAGQMGGALPLAAE